MINQKGQGSLEYLLIIAGAVLVAAIVIGLVLTSGQQGQSQTGITSAAALCVSTQNIPGVVESKAISGSTYYCCSNAAVADNDYFKGAYQPTSAPTETAQEAAISTCTLSN